MSKKIIEEEFLKRFYQRYPDCKIKILQYTSITNPCTIKCQICGKEYYKKRATDFLNNYKCCGAHNETRYEKVQRLYADIPEFEIIKKVDKDNIIIRHNICHNEFKRSIQSCLGSPNACQYCNSIKQKNMLSIREVQEEIDKRFFGIIQILDYNGQLEKNHYRCLKCGKIFAQRQVCLMQSRGCPVCDRWKSKGEDFIKRYLTERGVLFKEQVGVKELPLQHFDFGVYDKDGRLVCYIEVQGEQHFKENNFFKTPLEEVRERDNRKRSYCKQFSIPLYELLYFKGKFKNLDILPF